MAQPIEDAKTLGADTSNVELAGSAAESKSKMLLLNGSVDVPSSTFLPDARGDSLVSELRAIYPMLPNIISSIANASVADRLSQQHSHDGLDSFMDAV
jgi:hypothetical protein